MRKNAAINFARSERGLKTDGSIWLHAFVLKGVIQIRFFCLKLQKKIMKNGKTTKTTFSRVRKQPLHCQISAFGGFEPKRRRPKQGFRRPRPILQVYSPWYIISPFGASGKSMGSIICCSSVEATREEPHELDSEHTPHSSALPPFLRKLSSVTIFPRPS